MFDCELFPYSGSYNQKGHKVSRDMIEGFIHMNKNISRIALAFAGTAMVTLGSAGVAGAQESSIPSAENATTPSVTQTATLSKTSTSPSVETTVENASGEDTTPATVQADSNGKLPDYAIQDVTLDILDNDGKDAKKDVSVDDVKKIPTDSFTVRGNYKLKIPGTAKKGDKITIKFFNGEGGKNWKDNTRKIKVDGKPYLDITSKDGQTYTVELLEEACGLQAEFSLVSNLNGKNGESQKFDYTKATEAPKDVDWDGEKCSDTVETVTESPTADKPKPSNSNDDKGDKEPTTKTYPTKTAPTKTAPTRTAPVETSSPGAGQPGQPGTNPSSGGDTSSVDDEGVFPEDTDSSGEATIMTPDGTDGTTAGNTAGGSSAHSHDSQTVVSGGGFTDDSKQNNPKWNRSDGGESISVDDDDMDAEGPEVNTGGEVQSQSFFTKVLNVFA